MSNNSVAVLLTCHNRKDKTLACLECLNLQKGLETIDMEVFVVDDGSNDGTWDAIKRLYPKVKLIKGNGNLFWAGGMRMAWNEALKNRSFDYFWLVNDDTHIYKETLLNLMEADEFSVKEFGKQGIYVGSTLDPRTKKHSYGGQKLIRMDNYASERVLPNGTYQICQFCNANIVLVTASVVDAIGILCEGYTHSIADYDYSMQAFNAGFPVLVLPDYCGECINDHRMETSLKSKKLIKRIQYLYSSKGFAYKEFLHFVHKFFPSTYLNTAITLWIRTIFPTLWEKYKA